MDRRILLVAGLGIAGYFYLSTRQPVFQHNADGTYSPAGFLDRLTVALTGAQPPQPQQVTVNVPGVANIQYVA